MIAGLVLFMGLGVFLYSFSELNTGVSDRSIGQVLDSSSPSSYSVIPITVSRVVRRKPVGSPDTAEVDSLEVEDHVWYSSAHQC